MEKRGNYSALARVAGIVNDDDIQIEQLISYLLIEN
jgi:hypothetical protein